VREVGEPHARPACAAGERPARDGGGQRRGRPGQQGRAPAQARDVDVGRLLGFDPCADGFERAWDAQMITSCRWLLGRL